MADRTLSDKAGESKGAGKKGPKGSKSSSGGKASHSRPKTPAVAKGSSASDRDAERCQRALEHQFAKASKLAEAARSQSEEVFPEGAPHSPLPELSPQSFGECHLGWPPEGPEELEPLVCPPPYQVEHFLPQACTSGAVLQPAASARGLTPEATFTPMAAGLRAGEGQGPVLAQDLRDIIAQATSQGIALGLNQ